MRGTRTWAGLLAATACAGGLTACGGDRQDAGESGRGYELEVVEASFAKRQTVADSERLRIVVRNVDSAAVPNVAVTIETTPGKAGGAPQAFAADISDPAAADPSRPIWIVDRPPRGGDTAATNTWALGRLPAGSTRAFMWSLTAVKPGTYTVGYRVSPSLTGRSTTTGDRARGSFRVTIGDAPPGARVDADGKVVETPPDAQ